MALQRLRPISGRVVRCRTLNTDIKTAMRVCCLDTCFCMQRYTYIRFPSETVTRSGYQIKRKNFAVAAIKKGRVYSLVASARSDQYNPAKEKLLQHIVQSFRLRT
jgi:hypothetical protein